jgi:serine/threonine protein phosphatase PrpC
VIASQARWEESIKIIGRNILEIFHRKSIPNCGAKVKKCLKSVRSRVPRPEQVTLPTHSPLYCRVDRMVLSQNVEGGSTAVVCVLEKDSMRVHVYNVGDSECFMVSPSSAWSFNLLSTIHRAQNPREVDRIRMLNATHLVTIEKNRVNGAMEARLCGYGVSRAFGDHKYAKMPFLHADILSCEGDYSCIDLASSGEAWIVLHCDGLTECLAHDQVLAIMRERVVDKSALQVAEMLVGAGYSSGSTDSTLPIVNLSSLPHISYPSHRSQISL